jgi:cytoskeletal protein CcmA (bactofilin family)
VEGNITGSKRVMLNATARVQGDVTAPSMAVAEGAVIAGMCKVGSIAPADAVDPAARPTAAEVRLNGMERAVR